MLSLRRPLFVAGKSLRAVNSRPSSKLRRLIPKDYNETFVPYSAAPITSRKLSPDAKSPEYDPEEALPPLVILQAASKSGAMGISPEKALALLRRYQVLQRLPSKGWEEELCKEFNIKSDTLVLLSRIQGRCPSGPQRHLGRRLMLSASEMGDSEATIALIAAGIRSGSFRVSEKPLKRLEILAKEGNPRAMTLLGRTVATKGKTAEALEWFRKATRGPAGLDFEEAGEALVYEGELLMKSHRKEAIAVLRKAALELDDPSAYFYLAELEKSGSPNQIVYFMKAASSGITEAAHELGLIEVAKAVESADGNTPPHYEMAREWFQLAAADNYRPSMISMSKICRDNGEAEEARKWLNKANMARDAGRVKGTARK